MVGDALGMPPATCAILPHVAHAFLWGVHSCLFGRVVHFLEVPMNDANGNKRLNTFIDSEWRVISHTLTLWSLKDSCHRWSNTGPTKSRVSWWWGGLHHQSKRRVLCFHGKPRNYQEPCCALQDPQVEHLQEVYSAMHAWAIL